MTRPPLDLSLYLVTDTHLCGAVGVPSTVAAAVAAGVTAVQLRDPSASDAELVTLGRAVVAELAGTGVPLLVNDAVHLVGPIGAQGAHVGQGDTTPGEARQRLGHAAYLGLSVQTTAHVEASRGLAVDYLGVGPVFPQTTKPDAADPGGLERLARIVTLSEVPCVAIGGIGVRETPMVRATRAAGVAVVSAICGQPDVAAATRSLRAAWDGAAVPA